MKKYPQPQGNSDLYMTKYIKQLISFFRKYGDIIDYEKIKENTLYLANVYETSRILRSLGKSKKKK